MADLNPKQLTWAVLLARWVEFARSALALPGDEAGRAMKAAVPDIIALQSVTMALRDADQLSPEEQALGRDRARVLIERHSRHLHDLFPGGLHAMLAELITDAHSALAGDDPV